MTKLGDLKHVLAANVVRFRKAKGLNQEELGRLAKLSRAHMSLIETGKQNATLDTLDRLAVALGVEPEELLTMEIDQLP